MGCPANNSDPSTCATRVDNKSGAMLRVGTVSETVEVSAQAATVNTDSAEVSAVAKTIQGTAPAEKPLFTPRLQSISPTLVWKPEVITDDHGRAHLDFPMADNITAWSMSVIASTEAGQVGVADERAADFSAFLRGARPAEGTHPRRSNQPPCGVTQTTPINR